MMLQGEKRINVTRPVRITWLLVVRRNARNLMFCPCIVSAIVLSYTDIMSLLLHYQHYPAL